MSDRLLRTDSRREIMLKMRGSRPNRVILRCAVQIAATFRGRLRGHFSENEELLSLAGLPFAREVSAIGGMSRELTPDIVRAEMTATFDAIRREFDLLDRGADFEAVLEGTAPREFTGILAFGEPLDRTAPYLMRNTLDEIASEPATSGILIAGDKAIRSSGPVVVLLESGCDVANLVDTAERIARSGNQNISLVALEQGSEETEALLQAADHAVDPGTRATRYSVGMIEPRSLANLANSLKAGLTVAWAGGIVGGESAGILACHLECPLLLMR